MSFSQDAAIRLAPHPDLVRLRLVQVQISLRQLSRSAGGTGVGGPQRANKTWDWESLNSQVVTLTGTQSQVGVWSFLYHSVVLGLRRDLD
ncbi:hypothetical protein RRG08_020336 [Elysia crispata]|uniref:Uncharacterized protein n=1 Tax=Elysia crispata TaxID=231223 RepID=A0AAE1DYF6_9GAST|nr:hypothetical protein RRG08_020336 [Elysia crispata]